jgi:preprotein translocase subunit SecF
MGKEEDIKRTKKRALIGCLIWFLILMSIPAIFVGKFVYEMSFKETNLVTSYSPQNINKIEIAQKGEAVFFGPSKVRIHYEIQHEDHSISNDGKTLDPSNVSVSWKNDYEATVTLYGEEQEPETVEIHLNDYR